MSPHVILISCVWILICLARQHIAAKCPENCDQCSSAVMKCSRQDIPQDLPENIRKLYMSNFSVEALTSYTFSDLVWRNLTVLDIFFGNGGIIRNGSFVGLSGLRYLGIHGDHNMGLEPMVFQGLQNLRTLDLSACTRLHVDFLLNALDAAGSVLQFVGNLTLAHLQSRFYEPIDIDRRFFETISFGRQLTFIDISNINIRTFDFSSFNLLCSSLEYIKLRNITIGSPQRILQAPVCESLRTLDLSGMYMPLIRGGPTFEAVGFACSYNRLFDKVEILYMNGIISSPVNIASYHLNLSDCFFHMKKIEMRHNQFKQLNLTVTLNRYLKESVSFIDFSDNILEYLSPRVIYPSTNLEVLQLSRNNLFQMQNDHKNDFAKLLWKSENLRQFSIADNHLTTIHKSFFKNNLKLEYIDASLNRLRTVTFDFKHLTKLKYLDLSHNMIMVVGEDLMQMLDKRNENKTETNVNASSSEDVSSANFQVNLASNPYVCSCTESFFAFLEWIKTSESVLRKDQKYFCTFHDDTLNMLTVSMADLKASCARINLINNIKIIAPVLVVLLIVVVILIVFTIRRSLRRKREEDFIKQLENMENPFLVFLSFCSEDTEFVENHVNIPLQDALQRITQNNRKFICVGDREFGLGLPVHAEVMRCTEESHVVLFVISKTFCKKEWCRMEVSEAYEQRKPIIMLMKERVELKDMSALMRKIFNRYTHASWVEDDVGGHLEPDIHIVAKSVIALARKDADKETQL